jgi:hypothetical protein
MDPKAEALIEAIVARLNWVNVGPGLTVHLIDRAEAVGPARDLTGCAIVEAADGALRKMNGKELAAFAVLNPHWFKRWRLEGEEER